MRSRVPLFFLLTFILLISSTFTVEASPNFQDPDDALIRQVLLATRDDFGWTFDLDLSYENGFPSYSILGGETGNLMSANWALINAYGSSDAAKTDLQNYIEGATPFNFHDHTAYSSSGSTGSIVAVQVNRFVFIIALLDKSNANDYLQVLYNNAVAFGLIEGEAGGTNEISATPTTTTTPQPGQSISITVSEENHDPVVKVIGNSSNFASIDINGTVTDLISGDPIAGASIEITSGATSGSTFSAADGSYFLTAIVPDGQELGFVDGFDFALPPISDLTIEVAAQNDELLADGFSTSDILVQVKDPLGNPVKDREFNLQVDGEVGPGSIQPAIAITDENGFIQAIYTSFKPEAGQSYDSARHEVSVIARDAITGTTSSTSIFVSQYQLTVSRDEFIPACTQCTFPSTFTISLTDYWNNPIANAPLLLRIGGGSTDGTIVLNPNSTENQQELSVTTDSNGSATVYFKWQGDVNISEAVRQVVILDEKTHAQESREVNIHGLDIAIARVEEAGFTGYTGQQAFLKIYIKDVAHPELPLDRFNLNDPNKLGLKVTISQYESDGVRTSLTFEGTGGWEQDEGGLFISMFSTPHMPYVIPVNNGNTWYVVRVDPVIDQDIFIPDLFRANNDTIFALSTGTPDGWLHIWLKEGVLTPHDWTGMLFKCVGRFVPVLSQAMTVIDTLNQVYNTDALGLGQSTATLITENLQAVSGSESLTRFKAGAINNVVSCLQDTYSVYQGNNPQGSLRSRGVAAIAVDSACTQYPFIHLSENDADMMLMYMDRYIQGMLLDSPDQTGILVSGIAPSQIVLRDGNGLIFDDPERISAEENVVVYILPAEEQFELEVNSEQSFDIAIYEVGGDNNSRQTIRHSIQTETSLTSQLTIDNDSDYSLKIDYDDQSLLDETQTANIVILDIVKPEITTISPEPDAQISEQDIAIFASYSDNPGGTGIDTDSIRIVLDDVDFTSSAIVQSDSLSLHVPDIGPGEHVAWLVVSDLDGNAAIATWTFTVRQWSLFSLDNPLFFYTVAGGLFLVVFLALVLVITVKRKKSRSSITQDNMTAEDKPKNHLLLVSVVLLIGIAVVAYFALQSESSPFSVEDLIQRTMAMIETQKSSGQIEASATLQPTATENEALTAPSETPSPTPTGSDTLISPSNAPTPTATVENVEDTPLQIAFASDRTGIPQIWIVNIDGSDLRQLTDIVGGACQPSWSPDALYLAFTSPCSGNRPYYTGSAIYILTVATQETTPISSGGSGDYNPAWSPDGSRIMFTSRGEQNRSQIYFYDVATQTETRFSRSATFEFQGDWSPDASEIVYVTTSEGPEIIFLSDSSVSDGIQFSRSETDGENNVSSPEWAQNNEGIYYVVTPRSGGFPEIYYAPISEHGFVQSPLVNPRSPGRDPDQSFDGDWVAFEGWPDGENHDIWIIRSSGTELSRLTSSPSNDFDPAWRP